MAAPRWMATVNRRVTNRVLGPLATRAPGFGVIVHRGRRSGQVYRTPVNVFRSPAGFVVALTYGTGAGWVRNVIAAGGCTLETRGRRLVLGTPQLVHDESRRLVPPPVGRVLRLLRVADFLELSLVADRTSPARVPSWVPVFNRLARRVLVAGLPMGPNALVTIRGRVSGLPRTTPLSIVEASGRRWLIAAFGDVDWVRNLRAAGRATVTVRRRTEEVSAVELTPAEAVDFVRDVLGARARQSRVGAWIIRHVDGIDVDNPVEAARGRPVFELHAV